MTQDEAKAEINVIRKVAYDATQQVQREQRLAEQPLDNEYSVMRKRHQAELRELELRRRAVRAPYEERRQQIEADAKEQSQPLWETAAGVKVGDHIMVRWGRGYYLEERKAVITSVVYGKPGAAWLTKSGEPSKSASIPQLSTREWDLIKEEN